MAEFLALSAAACFACASLILGGLKGAVPLMQLTRWQLTASLLMTALASALLGGWRGIEAWQAGLLMASGVVGIGIASSTYYAALYVIGPRLTALLFTLTAPFSVLMGLVVLDEAVSLPQGAGIALVLAGIVLAIGLRAEGRIRAMGVALGVVTALGQAAGSLLARPAMAAGVEPFTAMAIRTAPAVVILMALLALPGLRRDRAPLRGRPFWLAMLAAAVGTALGMTLMMAALARGEVGIVSTLSSMTPVLILPILWAWTGQRPAVLAWVGAGLAVAGVALISLPTPA